MTDAEYADLCAMWEAAMEAEAVWPTTGEKVDEEGEPIDSD